VPTEGMPVANSEANPQTAPLVPTEGMPVANSEANPQTAPLVPTEGMPVANSEANPQTAPLVPTEGMPVANSEANPQTAPLVPAEDMPFANSEANPQIGPLVPAEDMPIAEVEAERRNSTPEIEQQENLGTALRPSKSLSSLQPAPQQRGLYVPPGTAVSQSSEVCAQGEMTSPPRQAETQEQPSSELALQEQEHIPDSGQEPAIVSDSQDLPDVRQKNATSASGLDQNLASADDDQGAAPCAAPRQDDSQQSSASIQGGAQTLEPSTVDESKEPQPPAWGLAAEGAYAPVPETALNADSGAPTLESTKVLESKAPKSPASDAAAESAQVSMPEKVPNVDDGAQNLEPTMVLESIEQQSPASDLAAENTQASVPEKVLNVDSGASADNLQSSTAAQQTWLHSWAVGSTDVVESSAPPQPPGNSSITSPIPTIRVQPTTESDEMAPSSANLDEIDFQSIPHEARKQSSESPADDAHMATPASGVSPSQDDAASPSAVASATPAAAAGPELPSMDTPSGTKSAIGIVKDEKGVEYPGFTKLAVRKARNLAANRLVLSILLGRKLAESTKLQLQQLARSPIRRPGNAVPVPGLSQIDGIAELEGGLVLST
jgi:hypothetical protein